MAKRPPAPFPGLTYTRELVNCGKKACKRCAFGPSHGPYWFAYDHRRIFTKKIYVGKKLPDVVAQVLARARGVSPAELEM